MDVTEAERAIGYTFKDKSLLIRALTLASADKDENNQQLEFFGDAIIEFVVSEAVYAEGGTEGNMTERRKTLVSDSALRPVSLKLGLDKLLIRGKNDTANKKAVPSAYEAVAAAIYLDGGLKAVKKFVLSTLDFSTRPQIINFKGILQEEQQGKNFPPPVYGCEDVGTPQKPCYRASVTVYGATFFGESDVKQKAEQQAAQRALEFIRDKKST